MSAPIKQKAPKHIHQYVRRGSRSDRTKSGDVMYQCTAPSCYHALGRSRLLGKQSICNDCHEVFILTRDDLTRAKPRCENCKDTIETRRKRQFTALAERILKEAETVADAKRINADSQENHETDDSIIPRPN